MGTLCRKCRRTHALAICIEQRELVVLWQRGDEHDDNVSSECGIRAWSPFDWHPAAFRWKCHQEGMYDHRVRCACSYPSWPDLPTPLIYCPQVTAPICTLAPYLITLLPTIPRYNSFVEWCQSKVYSRSKRRARGTRLDVTHSSRHYTRRHTSTHQLLKQPLRHPGAGAQVYDAARGMLSQDAPLRKFPFLNL